MVLGELFLGVLSNAIYDLSKAGLGAFFSGTIAERAIHATAQDHRDIRIVADALTRWCKSDDFIEKLESLKTGHTEGADEALVESFVEVGLFHDGLHNTHKSARRVLETFAQHLRRELYRSDDGLLIESSRTDLRQRETIEGLTALREEMHAGFERIPPADTSVASPPDPPLSAALNVLSSQLESVSSDLSDEKLDRLEDLRELFREGTYKEAYEGVWQFRRSPNWAAFSGRLRAAVLRVLATMTLSLKKAQGVSEAAAMAEEASKAEPSQDDTALRARIKVLVEGREAALEELSNPTAIDGFNFRIGLLIELGRVEEALESLRRPPDRIAFDAETQRIYALALLASKDVQGARACIRQALAERPRRLYVRYAAAMIDYFSALSPVVLPPYLVSYPSPVPLSMVKADAESREGILRAEKEFKRIAEISERDSDELKNVEAWSVACFSGLPDMRQEATELCRKRLSEDPGDVRIIPWVLFYGYNVDLSASEAKLEQIVEAANEGGDAKLDILVALVGIYLKHDAHQKALHLLEKKKEDFASSGQLDLWHYRRAQVLVAAGQPEVALDNSSEVEDQALQHAIRTAALRDCVSYMIAGRLQDDR